MRTARALACVAIVVTCGTLLAAATANWQAKTRDAAKDTIVHSVYFWFKDGVTEAQTEEFVRDGKALLAPLSCVKQLDIGRPLASARGAPVDRSYAVGVVVYFADQAGYDAYLKHPDHLKLIEKYKAIWQKIVVYDFVRK